MIYSSCIKVSRYAYICAKKIYYHLQYLQSEELSSTSILLLQFGGNGSQKGK